MDDGQQKYLRAFLRRLLDEALPLESSFIAFVLDWFPDIHCQFTSGMDRIARTTQLLADADRLEPLRQTLRAHYPAKYDALWSRLTPTGELAPPELAPVPRPHLASVRVPLQGRPRLFPFVIGGALALLITFGAAIGLYLRWSNPIERDDPCGVQVFAAMDGCLSLLKLAEIFDPERVRPLRGRCNIEYVFNQLSDTTTYMHCKSRRDRLNGMYFLVDLLTKIDPDTKLESEAKHLYQIRCDGRDKEACFRLVEILYSEGARDKDFNHQTGLQKQRCEILKKICQDKQDGLHDCLPLYMPGTFNDCADILDLGKLQEDRESVLRELCEKRNLSPACYALGKLYQDRWIDDIAAKPTLEDRYGSFCQALYAFQRSCQRRPVRLARYCRLWLQDDKKIDSLNPDCDSTGKVSCLAILRMTELIKKDFGIDLHNENVCSRNEQGTIDPLKEAELQFHDSD